MIGRYLGTWGLNWGKGTGARTEARVVYETGPMGLATPLISTVTWAIRDRKGVSMSQYQDNNRSPNNKKPES